MAEFSEVYKEAVASVPTDVIHYHTIEIRNPHFFEGGHNVSIFLVRSNQELEATLEQNHPLNPGQKVVFLPVAFDFIPPSKEPGVIPQMQITIDNVSAYLNEYLDLASSEQTPIKVIYRQYVNKDLTGPATSALELEVISCNLDLSKVSFTCNMNNLSIKSVPNVEYTSANFPNLVQ